MERNKVKKAVHRWMQLLTGSLMRKTYSRALVGKPKLILRPELLEVLAQGKPARLHKADRQTGPRFPHFKITPKYPQ